MATLKGDGASFFQILIGGLIALAFIATIATSIVGSTVTEGRVNATVVVPDNGEATDLKGRELISQIEIFNESDVDLTDHNISLRTYNSATTGLRTVQIYNNDSSESAGANANITYTYKPDGYLNLGGARAVHTLTIIMSALAILIFVIVVLIQQGALGKLIGRS